MFIATLRVEIVLEACWSRLLTLASCPKTTVPPFFGQENGAAAAVPIDARAVRRRIALLFMPMTLQVPCNEPAHDASTGVKRC